MVKFEIALETNSYLNRRIEEKIYIKITKDCVEIWLL